MCAVRVHRAKDADGVLPCVYSMHGGGYVLGTNAMDDPVFDELCPKLGLVGVSVEYRLAPETPYPGPLRGLLPGIALDLRARRASWASTRPASASWAISAGGGLAAALALLARDRGEVPVAFQLLDSPMLDDRQVTPSSRQDGLPVWSRDSNTFGWTSYLGDLYGGDDVPVHGGAGARHGSLGPAARVRVRRSRRRFPRRGRRLRHAAEPGGRADRAARVSRLRATVPPDRAGLAGREAGRA